MNTLTSTLAQFNKQSSKSFPALALHFIDVNPPCALTFLGIHNTSFLSIFLYSVRLVPEHVNSTLRMQCASPSQHSVRRTSVWTTVNASLHRLRDPSWKTIPSMVQNTVSCAGSCMIRRKYISQRISTFD